MVFVIVVMGCTEKSYITWIAGHREGAEKAAGATHSNAERVWTASRTKKAPHTICQRFTLHYVTEEPVMAAKRACAEKAAGATYLHMAI